MRTGVFLLVPVSTVFLTAAAYPPFNVEILAWMGLAPLLFALRRAGPVEGSAMALLTGVLFFMATFSWVGKIPEIGVQNWLLLMVAPLSFYFLIFGILYRVISRNTGSWIILGAPSLWTALEYARSHLFFLSVPWNLLAHSQYRHLPVIQIADITGVYGISFLMGMVNQLISEVPEFVVAGKAGSLPDSTGYCRKINGPLHLLTVAVLLVLSLSYGWYRLVPPANAEHLRLAMIQGNLVTKNKMPYAEQVKHLKVYDHLTRLAAKKSPDLIIWPASSLPAPINASLLVRSAVSRLTRDTNSHLLAGGAGYEKLGPPKDGYLPYSNSEFLISPSGRLEAQYNKIRLVPFNEYIPFQGKITWPGWISTIKKSFIPGDSYTIFRVKDAAFGSPICWENLFSNHFRRFVKDGANFMVSVTNEGFYGPTAGPYQTMAMTVFRAIENRVAIARSSTTGVSAIINPDGKIVEKIQDADGKDLFVSGFLVRNVPLSNKKTIYTRCGDIFAYGIIGITLLCIVISITGIKPRGHRRLTEK
ncbi:MAG: apolipoprotein N-acyltransferase [Deltaproteobacteria bacterium]|jgi:apolipoprotein N-acyltransferase|nr:apolipoprotein N-acyltransferase [Deltaproteobacteria bacterium]